MNKKIRVAICGYGKLGKGVEAALRETTDMELKVIFTRRDPKKITTSTKVVLINEMAEWVDRIDVVVMCGGSATDLPKQVPMFAELFNTVCSFDTHANISKYLQKVDKQARKGNNLSIISVGWDPGLFSIMREYADAIFPKSITHTFWGDGVSQGHSDAIRRIRGVKDACQYTRPILEQIELAREGKCPKETSARQMHTRECFVVPEENTDLEDLARIEKEIVEMPNYFADYDTTVHFITQEELQAEHSGLPHGGNVITYCETGKKNKQLIEYSLKLDSNPEFTGAILVAYARATYKMRQQGYVGAKTVLDVPPIMLNSKPRKEVIKELL